MRTGLALVGAALLVGACADPAAPVAEPGSSRSEATGNSDVDEVGAGWSKLPDLPIGGRTGAIVASWSETVVVAGGWSFLCPPGADCSLPTEPRFRDGAAFDTESGEWRPIADAPVGFAVAPHAVADDGWYVLAVCDELDPCDGHAVLLRYRPDDDAWDQLPAPVTGDVLPALTSFDGGVVASWGSDEYEHGPAQIWSSDAGAWSPLPDDPLAPVYDRFTFEYESELWTFGSTLGGDEPSKLGAAYDADTGTWRELAPSGTLGYQVWPTIRGFVLNPHFGPDAGGGRYDPATDAWSSLPDPSDGDERTYDLAGVIDIDAAAYDGTSGWVFDAPSSSYRHIEPRPGADDVYDVAIGSAGTDLVVAGGQTWASGDGELVAEVWRWSPSDDRTDD